MTDSAEESKPTYRRLVDPWSSEEPLFIFVLLASIAIWGLLTVTIFGIIYALFIGLFFLVSHILFITYIRGNGVKLGPDQMPELYNRIAELANKAGLATVPEAYLMQAGGVLNALATKLLRSEFLVLYTDLLDACGENDAARDMIIGHELGHLKEGHLKFMWFLIPGMFVPFLGSAYSRAREYTCDRYGAVLCNNQEGALLGLAILAAGGTQGPKVNIASLIQQRNDLNTGLMTFGKWLSSYPPLCDRIAVLAPELGEPLRHKNRGPVRALTGITLILIIPLTAALIGSCYFFKNFLAEIQSTLDETTETGSEQSAEAVPTVADVEAAEKQVTADLRALAALADEAKQKTGQYPPDDNYSLDQAWRIFRSDQKVPLDPFDGQSYGYDVDDQNKQYIIWSVGPDGVNETEDDLYISSPTPPPE
ncbi:M48 family metalloprotease [candidate division CSSED10-310 bacterium]|uniref:M48 family metalloprotease n=1 Tax=candidate division CSSED10-310 bacterium TaxID=2855610 RepID=A0ABV6YXU6_UNCC1